MEAAVALHVTAVDPGLRVALPWRPVSARRPRAGTRRRRPGAAARPLAATHWVRLYDVLPGEQPDRRHRALRTPRSSPGARRRRASAQALRGFTHPQRAAGDAVGRPARAARPRDARRHPRPAHARAAVARVLDEFERRVTPVWPRLRAQVAHTDLTVDNTLTDDVGLHHRDHRLRRHEPHGADHRPRVGAGLARRRPRGRRAVPRRAAGARRLPAPRAARGHRARGARRRVGGPQRDDDRDQLVARRAGARGAGVRRALQRDRACGCSRRWRPPAGTRWRASSARAGPRPPDPSLAARRAAAFGPAIDPLFYAEPIEVARAEGVWITDTAGRTLPRRLQQRARASATRTRASPRRSRARAGCINTHTRYLHPSAIELAERLAATCPPELDTVLLVNSGSEANDLAWRMATAVTGPPRRAVHRVRLPRHHRGDRRALARGLVRRRPARTTSRPGRRPTPTADASRRHGVRRRGRAPGRARAAPAAAILDGLITSDGIADLDAGVRAGARPADPRGRRRCGSPTRCRPATAAPATRCGASSASASSRTSSRSASRWATATRSPRSSPAARSSPSSSATRRCSAPSAATRSAPPPRSPCST